MKTIEVRKPGFNYTCLDRSLLMTVILMFGLLSSFSAANTVQDRETIPVDQQKRLEIMKSKGTEASLTIVPIVLEKVPAELMEKVAQVVGIFLERAGLTRIEVTSTQFTPGETMDFQEVAAAFGQFVKQNPMNTDYILYGEFQGSGKTGVTEIRGIVVDRNGQIVWLERQTPEDDAFKTAAPKDPMTCCVFLVERLRTAWGLEDPMRKDAPEGKLAKSFAKQTGLPAESEQEAMKARLQKLKEKATGATITVYPARIQDTVSGESAADLVRMINEADLLSASVALEKPLLQVKGNMNEMKMLWDLARAFRDTVRKSKPTTDYALYADYIFTPGENPKVWGVHFVICDQNGDWVIVDLQNNHHPGFKEVNPTTRQDCDLLVIRRLKQYLQ